MKKEPRKSIDRKEPEKSGPNQNQQKQPPIIINQEILMSMTDRDKRIMFSNLLGWVATQIAIMEGLDLSPKND